MNRFVFFLGLVALGACTTNASVGTGGPSAGVGVDGKHVNAGVSTNGTYANVDVVDTKHVDVNVGKNGPNVSVGTNHVKVNRHGVRITN